jgi:hypothetical protein
MSTPMIPLEEVTKIVCDKIAASEKHVTGITIANGKVTLTFNSGSPIEATLPADSDAQTGVVVGSTLTITNTDGSTAVIDLSPYLPVVAPIPIKAGGATVALATGDTLAFVAGFGLDSTVVKVGTIVTETFTVKTTARYQAESCDQLPMFRADGLIGLPANRGSIAAEARGTTTIISPSGNITYLGFSNFEQVIMTNPFCMTANGVIDIASAVGTMSFGAVTPSIFLHVTCIGRINGVDQHSWSVGDSNNQFITSAAIISAKSEDRHMVSSVTTGATVIYGAVNYVSSPGGPTPSNITVEEGSIMGLLVSQ